VAECLFHKETCQLNEQSKDRVLTLSRNFDLESFREMLQPGSPVLAIRIRDYMPKDLCEQVAGDILGRHAKSFKRNAFAPELGVAKMGLLFGEACVNPDLMDFYFTNAKDEARAIREAFMPYLGPIDKVRMDLDELWPRGAEIAEMHGKRMSSGMLRSTSIGAGLMPHQDDIVEEYPQSDWKPTVELVHNVYLSVPQEGQGGEFEVFDHAPAHADPVVEHYKDVKPGDDYLPSSDLEGIKSAASVVIQPEAGDLILFRGKCIHKVHTVKSGSRLTSCFHIGYLDDTQPLKCWI
jgi:hypothetical protein